MLNILTRKFFISLFGFLVIGLSGDISHKAREASMQEPENENAFEKSDIESLPVLQLKRTESPWGGEEEDDFSIAPIALAQDWLLVTVKDTLYMLDSNKQILWKWCAGAPILSQPVVGSNGIIYGVAFDGISFSLDIYGNVLRRRMMNGRAFYSQIKAYKDDQYLVVVDMSGYRENLKTSGIIFEDRLTLFKGEDVLWSCDFPNGAVLEVWGDRILAITYKVEGVNIVEIPPGKIE